MVFAVQLYELTPGAGRDPLIHFALQARGHWFEPSCAHQVRSLFRCSALVAKSKRRAKGLVAGDVQETLGALAGRLSTRSPQIVCNCLERAIRHAEVRDLLGRNVAALVNAPARRSGQPSKSLTLEQAQELLQAAGGSRLYAYVVVLSVTTELRTEELRAFRVERGDLDAGTVAVYRLYGPLQTPRRVSGTSPVRLRDRGCTALRCLASRADATALVSSSYGERPGAFGA
jgi:integrase